MPKKKMTIEAKQMAEDFIEEFGYEPQRLYEWTDNIHEVVNQLKITLPQLIQKAYEQGRDTVPLYVAGLVKHAYNGAVDAALEAAEGHKIVRKPDADLDTLIMYDDHDSLVQMIVDEIKALKKG